MRLGGYQKTAWISLGNVSDSLTFHGTNPFDQKWYESKIEMGRNARN